MRLTERVSHASLAATAARQRGQVFNPSTEQGTAAEHLCVARGDHCAVLALDAGERFAAGVSAAADEDERRPLMDDREAHWEVVERILFVYAKLNPGVNYIQVRCGGAGRRGVRNRS